MRQLFYHKMREKFITKCFKFFITKCDSYYKLRRFYYKMRRLLQIATVQRSSRLSDRLHDFFITVSTCQCLRWLCQQLDP